MACVQHRRRTTPATLLSLLLAVLRRRASETLTISFLPSALRCRVLARRVENVVNGVLSTVIELRSAQIRELQFSHYDRYRFNLNILMNNMF